MGFQGRFWAVLGSVWLSGFWVGWVWVWFGLVVSEVVVLVWFGWVKRHLLFFSAGVSTRGMMGGFSKEMSSMVSFLLKLFCFLRKTFGAFQISG